MGESAHQTALCNATDAPTLTLFEFSLLYFE